MYADLREGITALKGYALRRWNRGLDRQTTEDIASDLCVLRPDLRKTIPGLGTHDDIRTRLSSCHCPKPCGRCLPCHRPPPGRRSPFRRSAWRKTHSKGRPCLPPGTAADLEEARNAALNPHSCACGPAGYLEQFDLEAFNRRTAEAVGGQPAIDGVSRLLVGESLVDFAGLRRASFHNIACELAFQVHRAFGQRVELLATTGRERLWPEELLKATMLGVLREFAGCATGPTFFMSCSRPSATNTTAP